MAWLTSRCGKLFPRKPSNVNYQRSRKGGVELNKQCFLYIYISKIMFIKIILNRIITICNIYSIYTVWLTTHIVKKKLHIVFNLL